MPIEFKPLRPGQRRIAGYGWKPDLPDQRDLTYSIPHAAPQQLPAKIDLRPGCPPVFDQGQLGSCTANAIAAAIEFDQMKQNAVPFAPSRLFIYYNERALESTPPSVDSGAQIRDGIKSVASAGVCSEALWPYKDDNDGDAPCTTCTFSEMPSPACYTEAAQHKIKAYRRLDSQQISILKGCLASGYPFVFGFTVYNSFEGQQVAETGILNMPATSEKTVGGHAVLAVGYDDSTSQFIVRNSWGAGWGLAGYFMMPYAYMTSANLADDFWMIQTV